MEDRPVLTEASAGEEQRGWFRRLPPQTRVLLIALAVMGSCHVATGPPFYYSSPIRGRVTDEHTGKPTPGVVVVAIWWLDGGLGWRWEALYAKETVTDAQGEFVIPAMRPRLRPPLSLLCRYDPELLFYKPGYLGRVNNTPRHPYGYQGPCRFYAFKRYSYWDGKTIPLQPLTTIEQQADALKTTLSIAQQGHGQGTLLPPRRFPNLWEAMVRADSVIPPALTPNDPPLAEWREDLVKAR